MGKYYGSLSWMKSDNPKTGPSDLPRKTKLLYGTRWNPHSSNREHTRNLKKILRPIFSLTDDKSKEAIARVTEYTKTEYLKLCLMAVALKASTDADVSWATAMNVTLDKIIEESAIEPS